jgi:ABC-type Fe3+ transport system permease subunit
MVGGQSPQEREPLEVAAGKAGRVPCSNKLPAPRRSRPGCAHAADGRPRLPVLLPGLPLVAVFVEALAQGLPIYLEALKEPETRSAIWLTIVIALAVLPFNIVFGVAAAWAIAKFDFRGKSLLITLIDLPFAVSPVVAGLIFMLMFGAQGWFGEWLSAMTSRSSSPCRA